MSQCDKLSFCVPSQPFSRIPLQMGLSEVGWSPGSSLRAKVMCFSLVPPAESSPSGLTYSSTPLTARTTVPGWMVSFASHLERCGFESIVVVEHTVLVTKEGCEIVTRL